MNKNKSKIIFSAIVAAVLAVLFALPRFTDPTRSLAQVWKKSGIDCLPAHQNANQHFHPKLQIFVDDKEEVIPANIGIVKGCMAEIHKHDTSGLIHAESVASGKIFKLADFFAVWGKSLEREGFIMELTVDGAVNQELGNLILKDKQQIVIKYAANSQ